MIKGLYILGFIVVLTACQSENEYNVEDELYVCLESRFSDSSLNLEKILDTLELLYVKDGILKSTSGEDYRQYYQTNIDTGMVLFLRNDYILELSPKISIRMNELDSCVLQKIDLESFNKSKYAKISEDIEKSTKETGQISGSSVAKAHLKYLSPIDFEHPYYRANILLSLHSLYYYKYTHN